MAPAESEIPIVLVMFNRPAHTKRVLDAVALVQPKTLFVIADGPRSNKPHDVPKCQATRAIVDGISWQCDVRRNFCEENLGCGRRICSGLDWVFNQVDQAIILEDDCVPNPSFFRFCSELLYMYKDDLRIRTIAGSNFLHGKTRTPWSYHFSKFHSIWGWATWRRSWERTDMSMRLWPTVRDEGWLIDMLGSRQRAKFYASRFNNTYEGRIDSWAYPYLFSCLLDHSLAITPNCNLISNIGFGVDAMNTRSRASFHNLPVDVISFPLEHPPFIVEDRLSDNETFRRRCLPENASLAWRASRRLYYLATQKQTAYSVKMGTGKLLKPCPRRSGAPGGR